MYIARLKENSCWVPINYVIIIINLCRNSGGAWIGLVVGGGGWDVKVKFNLTMRPDGKINSSPVSAMTPIVRLQHGCEHVIRIPGTITMQ